MFYLSFTLKIAPRIEYAMPSMLGKRRSKVKQLKTLKKSKAVGFSDSKFTPVVDDGACRVLYFPSILRPQ